MDDNLDAEQVLDDYRIDYLETYQGIKRWVERSDQKYKRSLKKGTAREKS